MTPGRLERLRRRLVRGGAAAPTRYRMRERLRRFGTDFVVTTVGGDPAYRIDGRALRLRDTITLLDMAGQPRYHVRERPRGRGNTVVVEREGRVVATVERALAAPLRDRFDVAVVGGPSLHVRGNVPEHEYTITRDGALVATVSKRWFRRRDTYGVEVQPGEDDAFVLAVAAAIDAGRAGGGTGRPP